MLVVSDFSVAGINKFLNNSSVYIMVKQFRVQLCIVF